MPTYVPDVLLVILGLGLSLPSSTPGPMWAVEKREDSRSHYIVTASGQC